MAAVTINATYNVPNPHRVVFNVTAAADGDTLVVNRFPIIDSVLISPNSTSWDATEAYSATISGQTITFKLVGTATYPFWVEVVGHG